MPGAGLVEDLDILRGRLARGQHPDHGHALARGEILSTGSYSKVIPVSRIDDRALQPGPLYRKARDLYWAFAQK